MLLIQTQLTNNSSKSLALLSMMSSDALSSLALDLKAQVGAGLLSDSIASEKINLIAGIILDRECTKVLSEGCTDMLCN